MDFVRLVLLVVLVSAQRLLFADGTPTEDVGGCLHESGSVLLETRGVPGILRNVRVKLGLRAVRKGVGDTGQPHGTGKVKCNCKR